MKTKKIGFIGLGTMGFPICYGLYRQGYRMVLPTYRREADQSGSFTPLTPDEENKTAFYDEMLKNGCEGSENAADLAAKSDVIMMSMPTSRQVEANMYGEEGILANAAPGTIVIDLTSAEAGSTRKLSELCAGRGIDYLDAPVSGGQAGAIAQTLAVMVGGKAEIFEKVLPVLETIGAKEKVRYVGPSGAGDTLKCVNNFLSCTCFLATAEALSVAGKAGIDMQTAAQVISSGGGASNASSYKFPELVFKGKGMNMSVDLMLKDIGLYLAQAKESGVPSFIGSLIYQIFGMPSFRGDGSSDFVESVKQYEDWCGVKF